jgi:hypothetical protein
MRVPEQEHWRDLRAKTKDQQSCWRIEMMLSCGTAAGGRRLGSLYHFFDPLDLTHQRPLDLFRFALTACDATHVRAVDAELLCDSRVNPSIKLVSIQHRMCASIFLVTIVAHAHSGI